MDILIRQLLPPSWRRTGEADSGQLYYLKAILMPLKQLFMDLETFRKEAKSSVNLSAQVIAIENHIEEMTGIRYGVFLMNEDAPNHFLVRVPLQGRLKEKEITQFLQKVVPAGRHYQLIFY